MSGRVLKVITKSGSEYHVDMVGHTCQRVQGGAHYSGRGCDDAFRFERMEILELGRPMMIYWGSGRDKYSPDDGQDDETRERRTVTSPVVSIEPLVDCGLA